MGDIHFSKASLVYDHIKLWLHLSQIWSQILSLFTLEIETWDYNVLNSLQIYIFCALFL